jgi:hypothetical protein
VDDDTQGVVNRVVGFDDSALNRGRKRCFNQSLHTGAGGHSANLLSVAVEYGELVSQSVRQKRAHLICDADLVDVGADASSQPEMRDEQDSDQPCDAFVKSVLESDAGMPMECDQGLIENKRQ